MDTPLYDALSDDYDRFVDWKGRLAYELPFLEAQLEAAQTHRVLDVACGTGMHALALAEGGYKVVGTDVSVGMIERARENAAAAGRDVRFVVTGFGMLEESVGGGFDVLLCLGNSLPHVLTAPALAAALDDMAACLRPGGLLFIQNRNFDRVLQERQRWMPPQGHREGEREWVFMRFYDWKSDTRLTFNVVTLYREGAEAWQQRVTATQLWPLRQDELVPALEAAGFGEIVCWGDMEGAPFDRTASPNLIITARRQMN